MKDIRPDARTGGTAPNLKDLTCDEAQIEELLSEGESTEGDPVDACQADKPAEKKLH